MDDRFNDRNQWRDLYNYSTRKKRYDNQQYDHGSCESTDTDSDHRLLQNSLHCT